jgi:hypothetical protein
MPFVPTAVLDNLTKDTGALVAKWNKTFMVETEKYKKMTEATGMFKPSEKDKMAKNTENADILRQLNFIQKLNTNLEALKNRSEPDLDKLLSQIRQLMIISYIDEYAVGRKDKEISDVLKDLQRVILNITPDPKDNFFMKNEALSIKQGKGENYFDARFLAMDVKAVDPELPVSVPNALNKEIYTNYMKALVRVGLDVATPEWNDLVVANLGNSAADPNPYLITRARITEKDYFSEPNIQKRYDSNALDENLREKIHNYVRPGELRSATASPKNSVIDVKPEPVGKDNRSASVSLPDDAPPLLSQAPRRPGT